MIPIFFANMLNKGLFYFVCFTTPPQLFDFVKWCIVHTFYYINPNFLYFFRTIKFDIYSTKFFMMSIYKPVTKEIRIGYTITSSFFHSSLFFVFKILVHCHRLPFRVFGVIVVNLIAASLIPRYEKRAFSGA